MTYSVHMTLSRAAVISGQSVDNVGSWFPSMYTGLKLSFQYNAVLGDGARLPRYNEGPVFRMSDGQIPGHGEDVALALNVQLM